MKIHIVYWSGSGNTEAMAHLIAEGAATNQAEVVLENVSVVDTDAALAADVLVLGCPSMGDEVLEESEFEPFFNSIETQLQGKKIALFGSYGWGDGQWMRDWQACCKQAGAKILCEEGLIVNEMPEDESAKECIEFGRKISA